MTSHDLLVTIWSIDAALLVIAICVFFAFRRLKRRCRRLHFEKRAMQRKFRETQLSMMESCDKLRAQLDKAEADRDQAVADAQYKDKLITSLCRHYNRMKALLIDTNTQHNNLLMQYNSLLDKMPKDGEMPV